MKSTVKWLQNVCFEATSETGHTVVMDGPPDAGGENRGFRPMELLLLGAAGCTSYDVITILKKSRQDVRDCVAEISANRADAIPAVFTDIHFHFVVTGVNLKPVQVERAIKLSAEKYCSGTMMLEKGGVSITHDFDIVEA